MAVNQAINYNGTTSKTTIYTDAAIALNEFTLESWVWHNAGAAGNNDIFYLDYSDGYNYVIIRSWGMASGAGSMIRFQIFDADSADSIDSNNFTRGAWHHLAMVCNAAQIFFYVDGVSPVAVNRANVPNILAWNSNFKWRFGGKFNSATWPGKIDNVRYFNRGLTAGEVATLYNSGNGVYGGNPLGDASCIAYWPYEEGAGFVVNDVNGIHYGAHTDADSWIDGKVLRNAVPNASIKLLSFKLG